MEPGELEAAFDPDNAEDQPWLELLSVCRQARAVERLERLTSFLSQLAKARNNTDHRGVEERDALIARQAHEGADRVRICAELDRAGIPVSARMQEAGIETWREADQRKDFRRNIQSMISKAKPVKS